MPEQKDQFYIFSRTRYGREHFGRSDCHEMTYRKEKKDESIKKARSIYSDNRRVQGRGSDSDWKVYRYLPESHQERGTLSFGPVFG